ncbi:MAG: YkvA family protein [Actinomycetota bacterium]
MTDDLSIDVTDESSGREVEQAALTEYLFLAPRLARLVWRLARDPRVPARVKAVIFIVAGYLVSPLDIVPDFIPGLGQADDLFIAVFALDQILNRVPDEVVREHWDGDEDILQVVREVLDISTAFVPGWLKNRLGSK